jgi:ankyrin repeat protein
MTTHLSKLNTTTPGTTTHLAQCKNFRFSVFDLRFLLCDSLRSLRLFVKIFLFVLTACSITHAATTNDITSLVQRGLFEEEANHNLDAAMQAYQSAVSLHDKDRKLAATAIFRLGECARKQGKTNEANAYYQRIVTEFPDQTELANLSSQYVGRPKQTSSAPIANANQPALQSQPAKTITEAIGSDFEWQYREIAAETVKAEALWKSVDQLSRSRFGGQKEKNDLAKFFTTIQPDQMMINLVHDQSEATAKLDKLGAQYGQQHPEYKAQQEALKRIEQQISERADALVWSIEQKYKMLKEQEDALKARLGQTSAPVAKAKEVVTTSEEDQEIRKIKEMIQNSPDLINAKPDSGGMTPLQAAAASGHLKVAQYLVASGAEINPRGMTPLMYAAQNGHNAMVEFLMSKGANVNATVDTGKTALHYAAQHGFKIVVETLLNHGAEVNARDKDGTTPLFYAAEVGSRPIVELLLKKGADANLASHNTSPLLRTVFNKHPDCAELLIAHKAEVNFKDDQGFTPLLAAAANDDIASAKLLLDNGADAEAQIPPKSLGFGSSFVQNWEHSGFRPIDFAIAKDSPKLAELLLQHHANPNSKFTWYDSVNSSTAGTSPLTMAVRKNRPAIVEILLNHGADVNNPTQYGTTALHYAAWNAKTNIAGILLQHGANINALDDNQRTPLFYTVDQREPDPNTVAFLIAHHADVNLPAKSGYPPIAAVMQSQPTPEQKAVREQLLKAGANENFVRLKRISVRRNGKDTEIFTKGTNDWNHFTMFEMMSVLYGRNQFPSYVPGRLPALRSIPTMPIGTPNSTPYTAPPPGMFSPPGRPSYDLPFPDFQHLVIRRLNTNPLKRLNGVVQSALNTAGQGNEKSYSVDLENLLQSSDRSNDIQLEWGDIVEIPETDHPVGAVWQGISSETQARLMQLLERTIEIKIKGTATEFTVLPPMPICINTATLGIVRQFAVGTANVPKNPLVSPFGLKAIINNAGVLRSFSDTSRIKVTHNQNGSSRSITVNLDQSEEPWIKPGDIIEIPDRETSDGGK